MKQTFVLAIATVAAIALPATAQAIKIYIGVWQGVGRISREQLADFYEVSVATIDSNYQRNKDEFASDGVEVLRGVGLKDVRRIMRLTSKTPQETVYTPAGALRMGFILRD
jgi:hypothetical protein